jgi:hypothetical protein
MNQPSTFLLAALALDAAHAGCGHPAAFCRRPAGRAVAGRGAVEQRGRLQVRAGAGHRGLHLCPLCAELRPDLRHHRAALLWPRHVLCRRRLSHRRADQELWAAALADAALGHGGVGAAGAALWHRAAAGEGDHLCPGDAGHGVGLSHHDHVAGVGRVHRRGCGAAGHGQARLPQPGDGAAAPLLCGAGAAGGDVLPLQALCRFAHRAAFAWRSARTRAAR